MLQSFKIRSEILLTECLWTTAVVAACKKWPEFPQPSGREGERERRDSSSTLQSGNVRRMERNVAWSSVGKNSQPSHWRGLRAKLTVWYTIQYTLHYTASLYLLSRHRDINMKHCNTLRWPGLTSLQLEHNINHNGEKNEFL